MANHSQKWYDGTTSRNIRSSSSKDGLTALVNKLNNLERDMKLKESVHAIQVGCQIYEGPHLNKDCLLNEEVKQVEEGIYGEFGRTAPFNRNNGEIFYVEPPGYYTKTDNRPPYGASVNVLPRNIFEYLELTNLSETEMLVEMADMRKKAPLGIGKILKKYGQNVKDLDVRIKIGGMITGMRMKKNEISFICVSGENNETLPLGRKNGSRFRKMIIEAMEEVLRNDGEDSDETVWVCSLESLTRLNSSTWATKWFKRLVAYAKCNRDSYESELGDKELAGRQG
ncbi:hypothetical protein Tco_0582759 [Tanacetum coccineum]